MPIRSFTKRPKLIHFHHNLYQREEDRRPYVPLTPLCSLCNAQTRIRTIHKGRHKSEKCWGCTRNGCKGTVPINATKQKAKDKSTAH
jgi:hypothetical protein